MAGDMLNKLQELVVGICDNLYAERQLITKSSVKRMLCLHGSWSTEELEQQLPAYINEWRLHNLQTNATETTTNDKLKLLEAHLCKYKADLCNAQQTINQLKGELLAKNTEVKTLRSSIIQELKGLLNG